MSEHTPQTFEVISYGAGYESCICRCGSSGPCTHQWDGEVVDLPEGGTSVKCSRCGLKKADHDLFIVLPDELSFL